MPYALFVDSSNSVTLYPEWDMKDGRQKMESRHRTPSGKQWVYRWGAFDEFEFTVLYVSSSDASVVNSWWDTNTELLFMQVGDTDVSSVRIVADEQPLSQYVKPHDDLYRGVIKLETY